MWRTSNLEGKTHERNVHYEKNGDTICIHGDHKLLLESDRKEIWRERDREESKIVQQSLNCSVFLCATT